MVNAEKYHFSDFTTENYRKLLRLAKSKYTFCTFTELNGKEKFITWRHDIDFSMHRALKMAQIEAEEGIKATYCILLHSEFYNLLEKEISDILLQIIKLGHSIGLHFDSHYYDIKNETGLEEKLLFEKSIIENLFPIKVDCFCFHITNEFTIGCNKESYAGLINCYSDKFQKEVGYCSDSNGYWRFARLEDILIEAACEKLQVLTHPELWQDEIMSPKQRVYRCIDERAIKTKQWYDTTLKNHNRENIDW